MSKLQRALENIVLDIDEEGYAANKLLNNLKAIKWDSNVDHTEEDYEYLAQQEGVALLILLVDTILSFEFKTWLRATWMVLKFGI
jgi:hypothetical protein